MKEFRFSRLVIALVVLMKYMTKISDAGKNPAYTSRNFPGMVFMQYTEGNDLIYNEMKKWEKKFKGSFISFKAGKKPQHEEEYPIKYGIEALEVEEYPCCKREAKIKPIYKMCGSYCPFCGVRYEEH